MLCSNGLLATATLVSRSLIGSDSLRITEWLGSMSRSAYPYMGGPRLDSDHGRLASPRSALMQAYPAHRSKRRADGVEWLVGGGSLPMFHATKPPFDKGCGKLIHLELPSFGPSADQTSTGLPGPIAGS